VGSLKPFKGFSKKKDFGFLDNFPRVRLTKSLRALRLRFPLIKTADLTPSLEAARCACPFP
jgi:hypothetical protein